MDEEDQKVETYDVLPLSQYIADLRQGHMSKHQRMYGSARCRICPKRAPVANYVCMRVNPRVENLKLDATL